MKSQKRNVAFKLARNLAAVAALAAPLCTEAAPVLQNMDFGGQAGSASGAAILGQTGDYWTMYQPAGNESDLDMFTSVPGYNSVGATLSLAGWGGTYGGPGYGVSGFVPLTGDYLYKTSVLPVSGTASITINGLTAGDDYTWVLYMNQGGSSRAVDVTVGALTQSTTGTLNRTALEQGVNYLTFTGTVGLSGSLVADFAFGAGNIGEMDLNGFQLETVAIPEPSSYALVIGGIGLVIVLRRRHRAKA